MTVALSKLDDMYDRATACLDAEFQDLPPDGVALADGFRAAVAVTRSKGVEQAGFSGEAQAGTGQRTVARVDIKSYRSKLAETSNVIARKIPGFNENFPPPAGETDDELITNTRAVKIKAVEKKADFMLRGLSEEYLESGTARVEALEAALASTNEAMSHRGAATGSKKTAYQEADEFFDELDIYIRNHYADKPDKLNAWRIATHIERSSAKKEPPPAQP